MEQKIIKSGHFYLLPQLEAEPIEVDGVIYHIFNVLDSNKKPISKYDFLHIRGSIRLDYEEDMFRLYPDLGDVTLVYNVDAHTIYSGEAYNEEETRKASRNKD